MSGNLSHVPRTYDLYAISLKVISFLNELEPVYLYASIVIVSTKLKVSIIANT